MAISGSTIRFTGMATGLDTDSIIKDLMKIEQLKVDRVAKKKQLAEWRQEQYTEITKSLRSFKDEFFDVLKPDTYMLSQKNYKQFAVSSTKESIVTAVGNSGAVAGDHKITVEKVATAAVRKGESSVTQEVRSGGAPNYANAEGKQFTLTIDGTSKVITMVDTNSDGNISADDIQKSIANTFGTGKINVDDSQGYITFTADNTSVHQISIADIGEGSNTLSILGFNSGDSNYSNRLRTYDSLYAIQDKLGVAAEDFFDGDNVNITINGVDFTFEGSTTLGTMISEINSNAEAGVTMQYDDITDQFMITAKQTGAGNNVEISEAGSGFFTSIGMTNSDGTYVSDTYTAGTDADVTLDGVRILTSSNTFTANGVTYTLRGESTEEQTISLSQDVDGVFDSIVSFVGKYNELIDKINGKVSEEYDRDYQPLTDEEKETMSEEDIEKWEEKAKTGLLRNDSILERITSEMRSALYSKVDGVSIGLYNIGITTSNIYTEQGKLIIDEQKLKDAIRENPDSVMNLFSKESTSHGGTTGVRNLSSDERSVRTKEEGLAYRLFDIIEDNISTFRDSNDRKGILLEKAGMEGDASFTENLMYDQIKDYEENIYDLQRKMAEKEESYYRKFAALESAMNEMNNQANWLTQQLGGGQ